MSQENNFVPEQEQYKKLRPFQIFMKNNFPFIENTFMELDNYCLLAKVTEYLNNIIDNENKVESNVTALYNAFVELNNYVSNYFDNLDVQEEINNKLDDMVKNGELQALLNNLFNNYVSLLNQEIYNRELQDSNLQNQINSISSGSPAGVYSTVSDLETDDPDHDKIYVVTADGKWYYYNTSSSEWVAGGTYQATSLGDNVSLLNIDSDFKNQIKTSIPTYTVTEGYAVTTSLNKTANESYTYTSPIHLNYKDKIKFYGRGNSGVSSITLCDINGNLQRSLASYITTSAEYVSFTAQMDCYVVLCSRTTNQYENVIITNNILSNNQFNELFEDKISFINNQLIMDSTSFNNDNFTEDYYVNTINGSLSWVEESASAKFYASNFIEIHKNSTIILKSTYTLFPVPSNPVGICFYDINYNFIEGVRYGNYDSIIEKKVENAKYIRFTVAKNMIANKFWLYYKNISDLIENNSTYIDNSYYELYKSFDKVGIIGDSLASGESAYKDNGNVRYVDLYQFSWGQFMARNSGNTYYNFSRGGLTTRTWLTNEKGLALAIDGNHDCSGYIMGLGVNDTQIENYLGTSSDIDLSDYHNNADSFYGNYAKIIQILTEYNPKVKFFLTTIPSSGTTTNNFNTAIRNICEMFDNCFLIDLASPDYITQFQNGSFIYNNRRSGHYNAIAYNRISQIISNAISKVMLENYEDFEQVEFILTDYEWTD